MSTFYITKPSRKDPTSLRVVRQFDTAEDALRWATRYIYKDDIKLFIDDQFGHRYATVEYDYNNPIVTMSKKP